MLAIMKNEELPGLVSIFLIKYFLDIVYIYNILVVEKFGTLRAEEMENTL